MFNSRNEMINYFKDREERKYLNWNQNKNINNNNDFDNEFTFTNYVPLKFKQTTKQIISSEKKINSNDNFDKNQKEKQRIFLLFQKAPWILTMIIHLVIIVILIKEIQILRLQEYFSIIKIKKIFRDGIICI